MRRLIINLNSAFVGEELDLVDGWVNIVVSEGIIEHIGRGKASEANVIELSNSIALPPLANLHVHVLDYVLPDVGWDLDIDDLVGDPYGIKYLTLRKAPQESLVGSISRFLSECWRYGVGVVVEFREGGVKGALLDRGLRPKTHLVMGMPTTTDNAVEEVRSMASYVDGIGISSPLYYDSTSLRGLGVVVAELGLQVHAHISEVPEAYEGNDLGYLLKHLKPTAIVHGTYLSEDDLRLLKDLSIPMIICPRANSWFVGSLPNLKLIYELGLEVGVGTDNAGWVKADIWRDLELIANTLRVKGVLDPRWLLKVATNASIVGIRNYLVEGGKLNLLVINDEVTSIKYSKDRYLAVVRRGGPEAVGILVINGELVWCSEEYRGVCSKLGKYLSTTS